VLLPDGTAWYTDVAANRLVRINPDKSETAVIPVDSSTTRLSGLALAGDQLWFSKDTSKRVGRFPLGGGEGAEFQLPNANSLPTGIAAGPAGELWFYDPGRYGVGRVAGNGAVTEFRGPEYLSRPYTPTGLAITANGTVWTTSTNHNAVYRIGPTGGFTRFDIRTPNAQPGQIAAAPDGSLWFTMPAIRALGRITPNGDITEHPIGTESPTNVAVAPDGTVWFTMKNYSMLGWIRPGDAVQKIRCGTNPGALAIASDGNPWMLGNRSLIVFEKASESAATETTRAVVTVPPVLSPTKVDRPGTPPAAPSTAVERVSSDELARRISNSKGRLVVHVTSFDPNCSFCVKSNPVFDEFVNRNRDRASFVRHHTEPWNSIQHVPVLRQLQVRGVPTIVVFENGAAVKRVDGYRASDNLDVIVFGEGR
jgi:virginiamycin B lyase